MTDLEIMKRISVGKRMREKTVDCTAKQSKDIVGYDLQQRNRWHALAMALLVMRL